MHKSGAGVAAYVHRLYVCTGPRRENKGWGKIATVWVGLALMPMVIVDSGPVGIRIDQELLLINL